jgi:hypothetical protein|tara:strand:- start:1057 stop:1476 length:420 start_codon:yes stop_codon:yes gene_type:complete
MKKSELKSFIKEEIISLLTEASEEELKNAQEFNKELEKTIQLKKDAGIEEVEVAAAADDDDEDKKAIAAAKKARGKFKQYDLAIKAFKDIEAEMMTLGKEYGRTKDGKRKEEIKNILRKKTPIKKEAEALVKRLEKDVV